MNVILNSSLDALQAQRNASDPGISAWVSANAGSGKTRVLTDRVIRLLFHGADPSRILCLTYTKAAAANMANRVFERLRDWARHNEPQLRGELEALEDRSLTPAECAEARRLFARALECPGGLKVQTIHAFAERLLHRFPFEAGVAASFSVLDEAESAMLLGRARSEALRIAVADPESGLGRAVRCLACELGESWLEDLLQEAVGRRHEIAELLQGAEGLDGALRRLAADLAVAAGESLDTIRHEMLNSGTFPEAYWTSCIEALSASGKSDAKVAARLRECLGSSGRARAELYLQVFFTKGTGDLRKEIVTRSFAARHPQIAAALAAESSRLHALVERRRAVETVDATRALLTVAEAVIADYARLKREQRRLDFEDLVHAVRRLLSADGAAWVLYKLDGGIDHILIDEAQDTSPAQWSIVNALASEFFAGHGARPGLRTVFAVGDEKQSIYSFQGARPEAFDEMRRVFARRASDARQVFRDVRLIYSFRSTVHVLGAVDRIFERADARKGLSAVDEAPVHQAVRTSAPGFVEIWPVMEPEAEEEPVPWDLPFGMAGGKSPVELLARRISHTILTWLDAGSALFTGRPIRPGDILILVQRRGSLFDALIRALKARNVPVAGADRLTLLDNIAVMDCLAAADVALLPDDDLTLAALLKSPLIGLDEDELFALAHGRRGTLWSSLNSAAAGDLRLEAARGMIGAWLDRADFQRPFEFFSQLLTRDGGRRRLLARMGPEADDALDELLNLALAYEQVSTPSLQGFLSWLRSASRDVKRSLDMARDEVRVMTVHNAKGLEAPIVFLADTLTVPEVQKAPRLLPLAASSRNGRAASLAWRGASDRDPGPVAAAREAALEAMAGEHRRLLYVAMTRAADRLYVCAAAGRRKRPDGNWYDLVCGGLMAEATPIREGDGAIVAWRWARGPCEEPSPCAKGDSVPSEGRPSWLDVELPQERVPKPVTASSLLLAIEAEGKRARPPDDRMPLLADPVRQSAIRRGSLVHRLLQSLPNLAEPDRRKTALRFLAAQSISESESQRIVDELMRLLSDHAVKPVFGDGSRAEVPIVGALFVGGEERPVSGVIDRLVVLPDRVLFLDYKTDRNPPRAPENSPRAYLTQLAAYRALLAEVYPDRPIDAALLWTVEPRLMPIPSELLDRALAG